jgi:acetyltransferase
VTRETRAILLYVEAIRGARKFMSAGRAAARNKRRDRRQVGPGAGRARRRPPRIRERWPARTLVYDAALRRAGMLRVATTRELFDAAETLARVRNFKGERLAIVRQRRRPGVMATDALVEVVAGWRSSRRETIEALDARLPRAWSRGNPVDLIGDAPAERYASALNVLMRDQNVDCLLFIHAPSAIVSAPTIAQACVPLLAECTMRRVLSCWMGAAAVEPAKAACAAAGLPTYATPEEAVGAVLHLAAYQRNQEQLMEVPPSLPEDFEPDTASRCVLWSQPRSRQAGSLLTEPESKQVLAAYGIPVVQTRIARFDGRVGANGRRARLSRSAQDPVSGHHAQVRS